MVERGRLRLVSNHGIQQRRRPFQIFAQQHDEVVGNDAGQVARIKHRNVDVGDCNGRVGAIATNEPADGGILGGCRSRCNPVAHDVGQTENDMRATATQLVLRHESTRDKNERIAIRRELAKRAVRDREASDAFNWLERVQ